MDSQIGRRVISRDGYHRPQRNWGCRINKLIFQGLDLLVLENETLRIGILVGRGADIVEFLYKPLDIDFVWLSNNGIRHPALRSVTPADARMTFYDTYPGGWQEVFPTGGAPSGGPDLPFGSYGMHGEAWHRPWDWEIIEDSAQSVSVRLSIRTETLPYLLTREMRLEHGHSILFIDEVATNDGRGDYPLMWGHHITFGRPFLGPGARIELPPEIEVVTGDIARTHAVRRLAPNRVFPWNAAQSGSGHHVDLSILPKQGSPGDMCYLQGFKRGEYVVRGARNLGLSVIWDAQIMPYVWFWQEFGAWLDYPWFGRHYNIGLEPFTSTPREGLEAAVKNGTAATLKAGEEKRFHMAAQVLTATAS